MILHDLFSTTTYPAAKNLTRQIGRLQAEVTFVHQVQMGGFVLLNRLLELVAADEGFEAGVVRLQGLHRYAPRGLRFRREQGQRVHRDGAVLPMNRCRVASAMMRVRRWPGW